MSRYDLITNMARKCMQCSHATNCQKGSTIHCHTVSLK